LTNIKMPTYDISIYQHGLDHLEKHIKSFYQGRNLFVVTDETVYSYHIEALKKALSSFNLHITTIKPGEKEKNFDNYINVSRTLIEMGIKRSDLIIAFGGGVVGDLTGFVASTLYRGIPFVQIPTTLLSMVDASIGGKVAIDLPEGKNLLGSFYNPKLVFIDTCFLETLSDRDYRNGLAEMIKAGLIGDSKLYHTLKTLDKVTVKEIKQSILVKKEVVIKDPYEKKERMLLNFGHTFGHAIEKKHQYETYKHGEAISYGMLIALEIGVSKGYTNKALYQEVEDLLIERKLVEKPLLVMKDYLPFITHDKKFLENGLHFIIVKEPGVSEIITVKEFDL